MKIMWPVLLAVFRTLYFGYALWCLIFPLALVYLLATTPALVLWPALCLALFLLAGVYLKRTDGDPNPWQSGFMAWFGTLKRFRNRQPGAMVGVGLPSSFLVENPGGYRIGGRDLRAVLGVLEPGDILLRGYQGYVDGSFIRRSSRCSAQGFRPGWYTHAALYVGRLSEDERQHVPTPFAHNADYFETGEQMVVHAMAKGVHTEDILTFTRCDYLTVLRLPAHSSAFDRKAAIDQARMAALSKIGQQYDFDCSDTTRFHRFSCSELVYYCYRNIRSALALEPRLHALYPLGALNRRFAVLQRTTLTPDDYAELAESGHLRKMWEDAASAARPGLGNAAS
jgi:hypothetical protein